MNTTTAFINGINLGIIVFVATLLAVSSIPTKGQRQARKIKNQAYRTYDVLALARINKPWLYTGSMGESPYADPMRTEAQAQALAEITRHHQRHHQWAAAPLKALNWLLARMNMALAR